MSSRIPMQYFLDRLKNMKHSYSHNTSIFDYKPILERLNLPKDHNIDGKSQIIDLYPTYGPWSYHLNKLLNPEKHLLMEPHLGFNLLLQEMITTDSQNKSWNLVNEDPFLWETFSKYVGPDKLISPPVHKRDHLNPEVILTAHLAYPRGEILLVQWLQCALNGNWVHQFGNVRMLIWCFNKTALKLVAKPGEKNRHKNSLIAELASNVNIVATTDPTSFSEPVLERNNPMVIEPLLKGRSRSEDITLLDIKPIEVPIEFIDEWDYVTKQLFVVGNTPLRKALCNVGPGADIWFNAKLRPALLDKIPHNLTKEEIIEIVECFMAWPLKPDIYEAMLIPCDE